MKFLGLVLLALLAGCQERVVTFRVSIPDLAGLETPVPDLIVTFLPYDRDSILRTLETGAPPRPHVGELDSLFRAFRTPFQRFLLLSDSAGRARQTADSVRAAGLDPAAPETAAAALASRLAAARTTLDAARRELWPTITAYRQDVAAWEDSVYRDYRKVTRSQADRIFATPVADTTDALGWGSAAITSARWWATARTVDPADPNREWYWNVRVEGDTVHLDPRTGRNRPRY
ncbi:MAG: hypothetical protein R2882_12170 [Gemmatimonadales bacterium]